ncbi:MAG: hypothetical protein ACLPF1_05810 [Methanoregula sp.]|uniref:hypothetical protein n=1 Tax=Methanoregula sp. TaxID=2052170 RepID=UPI003FD726E7
MRFSEIGHRLGWCPKKRRSQVVWDHDFMGISIPGGFTMDEKKDEIGRVLPITFVKRILIFILALVVVMNFGVFYFHDNTAISTVLGVTIFEIVYMVIFFAFWVPRYQRAGAQVRW